MFTLASSAFRNGEDIPVKYAHRSVEGGKNCSPAFQWSDPPLTTKSFALSMVDPHPVAKNWIHWLVINIPFRERKIVEGASRTSSLPLGAKELMTSYNELGYGGPAPPKGSGKHSYVATIYALNVESVNLGAHCSLREFENAIDGKVIAEAMQTGMFERK